MARPFLAADGQGVLDTLKVDLERIGGQTTDRVQELELRPLRTRPTRDYEAGSRSGGQDIYALIKGNWELKSIGRREPKRKVAFVGKASAVIELWPKDCLWMEMREQSKRLAMWRIELGADDAPGCYFHTQVLGDREELPFPQGRSDPTAPEPIHHPDGGCRVRVGRIIPGQVAGGGQADPRSPETLALHSAATLGESAHVAKRSDIEACVVSMARIVSLGAIIAVD